MCTLADIYQRQITAAQKANKKADEITALNSKLKEHVDGCQQCRREAQLAQIKREGRTVIFDTGNVYWVVAE